MKPRFIIINIITILSIISCINQNKNNVNSKNSTKIIKQQKIEKIELTERTRGTNRSVVYTPNLITARLNGDSTQTAMSLSEWENISRQAETLDLSKISNLQSPTTGRYTDRALAATIIITSNGITYTSATFDSGIPPKELEALYNTLQNPKEKQKKPLK
ncbi:hypothetical protein [Chryseobacterium candidae]|uniref:Lipoprotein n=1 Tax=Chryseobacterium candidae TaxID=1978493 RepID=A0ABY2R3I2_9FLAO|nr:hypothetical protein [Chryseobacterium candidae]THV56956.1 hypothetical protein EK417_17110 [Chryseobacterium candidae]